MQDKSNIIDITQPEQARLILLQGLVIPQYAIKEFYKKKRKESGYSKTVFWQALNTALDYYDKKIESKIAEMNKLGNEITDHALPLNDETGGLIKKQHIGRKEVSFLRAVLSDLYKFFNLDEPRKKKGKSLVTSEEIKSERSITQLKIADHIKEGLANKKTKIKNQKLVAKDNPQNKEIIISALKAGGIIDLTGKPIPPPRSRKQYLNGIIDALKEYKILDDQPHTTLHRLMCEEILHTKYDRVTRDKFHPYSAYNRGFQETSAFLTSAGIITPE